MPFNHFDIISPIYERFGHFDRSHPLLALLELPDKGVIMDIGGGTGRVARVLSDSGCQVVVVDVSAGMLTRVHGNSGLIPLMADAAALPIQTGSVQRVLIVDALHHIKRQPETIRELCRLLEPGGVGVVVEPDTRVFLVKLIVIMEFILLMGSHFLTAPELLGLFDGEAGKATISAWQGNLLLQFRKNR
jgi:demethylmenaquinone methyltransferase/2-methoxy-6-polyprenyl-1,4-benzoquinol methylase